MMIVYDENEKKVDIH